jgi:hypothetical protein
MDPDDGDRTIRGDTRSMVRFAGCESRQRISKDRKLSEYESRIHAAAGIAADFESLE